MESKQKGWHSRRHQTAEAHNRAVGEYLAERGPENRKAEAKANADFMKRNWTPEVQLERLDARLGKGVGAKRERARLAKLIKS